MNAEIMRGFKMVINASNKEELHLLPAYIAETTRGCL